MVADDARPWTRLPLLSAAERRRVVEEWNATAPRIRGERASTSCFEAQVARTPDAVALVFEDETLSYAELNARANRLAHHLRALGVGPDVRVGICVERSLEMVVAVLAVLKAGGAYVPLDPGYPAERLAYMLADSAPAAVLAQARLRERCRSARTSRCSSWTPRRRRGLRSPRPTRSAAGSRRTHLAYVIYTSGSTGRPKGVRVPHGSLGATLARRGRRVRVRRGRPRAARSPPSPSTSGCSRRSCPSWPAAPCVLVPRERVPDVPRLVEDLARCTGLHAVPALMRRIVEEVRASARRASWRTLRHAFVGGDAVAPDLLEEMRAAFPAAAIHVLYGPTEAAIICAAHRAGRRAGGAAAGGAAAGRTPRSTCWTPGASRCRSAWPASCTSAAPAWRAATWAGRG